MTDTYTYDEELAPFFAPLTPGTTHYTEPEPDPDPESDTEIEPEPIQQSEPTKPTKSTKTTKPKPKPTKSAKQKRRGKITGADSWRKARPLPPTVRNQKRKETRQRQTAALRC